MSFFVFASDAERYPALDEFASDAHENGFQPGQKLDLPAGRLQLFGDMSGHPPAFLDLDNGDFAAALGTLIYRGRNDIEKLRMLYDDFDIRDFDWSDLLGIHTLLIRKHGVLHVLGDGLGASKIYTCDRGDLWSSSFVAMCRLGAPRTLDIQACYEYAAGGSVFGTRTPIEQIRSLPSHAALLVGDGVSTVQLADPINVAPSPGPGTLDAIANQHITQLDQVFEPIAAAHGDAARVSFSGGFDSRLMLAMLMRHGIKPTLFVYGRDTDDDVRIARLICEAEGLNLQCVDKSQFDIEPDAFADDLKRDFLAFDGWKVEQPLFDFGVDRRDRLTRHTDGQVPLNGSLGEIYRNFHYMPDRATTTGKLVSTFYSRYDPQALTSRFDENRYRALLAESMRAAIGVDNDHLERRSVEALYPKFRGRFWTGRDAQVNQRFGPMYFPYLEHIAIANTSDIPIRHKDLGILQGRMIQLANPKLAAYPNDYGFGLSGPRPLKYRVKTALSTYRPSYLRKLSFRLQHRHAQPRRAALHADMLARAIDTSFPLMGQLFTIDRLFTELQFGRVATLEYLGQQLNLSVPERTQ